MLKKIKSFLFENKTDKQTIIKNTFWLMLAEGISKGGMFFITILIARLLGPEQFGILSFVMSFVAMFIVITDFGLTTLMVREVSRDHSKIKDYLVNLSFLKVILGVITFLLVLLVSQFIGKGSFYITLILIYCGYAILNNFGEFIRSFFRPSEKMQYEALLKIINGILMLVIVLSALFLYGDLESILYGYLIAGGISLVISLVYIGRKFEVGRFRNLKLNKLVIRDSLKSGVYLMGGLIFMEIYFKSDQIMLGFYGYTIELGIYNAMYQIVILYGLINIIFFNTITPKLTLSLKNNIKNYKNKIYQYSKGMFVYSFIMLLIIIFFGNFIVTILYGVNYSSGYNTLLILSLAYLFLLTNSIKRNSLKIEDKEFLYMKIILVGVIFNIILNLILIPKYGMIGAASGTLITEIIITFYTFVLPKDKI